MESWFSVVPPLGSPSLRPFGHGLNDSRLSHWATEDAADRLALLPTHTDKASVSHWATEDAADRLEAYPTSPNQRKLNAHVWPNFFHTGTLLTFCIGIRVREGIIALADTRIVRGSEQVNKKKLAEFLHNKESLFTMTSGLRSVRDKTLVYVEEKLRESNVAMDRLYQFVNLFGDQLRRVKNEDAVALATAGLQFNLHAIIGGCLAADTTPQLFYVYPEGNWLEASPDSPYFIIGRTYYGKFILDRLLTYESSLQSALALALLAFDATRTSVTDVDYPIDVAVIATGTRRPIFKRYDLNDLQATTTWWSQVLRDSLTAMPMNWAQELLEQATTPSGPFSPAQDSQISQPE